MKSFVKMLILVALANLLSVYADAQYISEIKQSFSDENTTFGPSPIFSAPATDGSYLICAYMEQGGHEDVTGQLAWTDENSHTQSNMLLSGSGSQSGCTAIRNDAETAATIQTFGTPTGAYSVYAVGLGFWTASPQKQGGLTEPISATYSETSSLSATTLVTSATYSTYLVSLVLQTSDPSITATLQWTDAYGSQSRTLAAVTGTGVDAGSSVFLIRSQPGTTVTLSASDSDSGGYSVAVKGVLFGTPASGTGPLTWYGTALVTESVDYGVTFSSTGMMVYSENAQTEDETDNMNVGVAAGDGDATSSSTGGGPASIVFGTLGGEGSAYFANCSNYSSCPTYRAEFNIVQFQ